MSADNSDNNEATGGDVEALRGGRVSPLSDEDDPVHDQLGPPPAPDLTGLLATLGDDDDDDIDENAPLEVDYGSDDDVSVESDDGGLRDTVELSRRTMNLMDSFRDYVSEMDPEKGEGKGAKKKKRGGEAPLQLNAKLDWFGSGGLRDFGTNDSLDERIDQEFGTSNKRTGYKYAWLRSKRVKRGMGMIGIAAAVIAVAMGVSKVKKELSLPDWNAELEEVLEEEREKKEHSQHDEMSPPAVPFDQSSYPGANPPPADAQPSLSGAEGILADMETKPSLSGAEGILADVLSHTATESHPDAPSDAYLAVAEKYDPKWFGRPVYDGRSYPEALVFCNKQEQRVPCPYEAVCPDGAGSVPYGGYKDEPMGTWAAVLDTENSWVQVSSGGGGEDNKGCMLYEYTHASAPEWGYSRDDEEQTRHILCCKSQGDGDVSSVAAAASDDTDSPDQSQELLDHDLVFDEVFNNQPMDESVVAEEYSEAERLHPMWWDRSSGYNGKTYQEAKSFCESQSNDGREVALCPYTALCPTGPHHIPYGGTIEAPGELWVAVSDSFNSWAQVGPNSDTCVTYMNEYLMPPDWGTTGEDAEEITTHVMCCATKGTTVGSHPDLPPAAEADSWLSAANGDADYVSVEKYLPVWYDRSSGWSGETYSQGEAFCAALGPTHGLCPLEAYCPHGGRSIPYGGGIASADLGEGVTQSWAPIISDVGNDWIQIGKGGEGLCLTYTDMYLKEPSWGESAEDSEDITRYLMCCGLPAAGDDAEDDTSQQKTSNAEDDSSAQQVVIEAIPSPPTDGEQNPVPPTVGYENPVPYEYVSQKYHPVLYERSDGWRGNTYGEAVTFCASQKDGDEDMMLCSFEAVCPLGPQNTPFGGFREGDGEKGVSWAAIINEPQLFVSIGIESPCTLFPDGVFTGATPYVMCCNQHEVLSSFGFDDEVSSEGQAPVQEASASTVQPVWYDRDSGWKGQTYDEALGFCESLNDDSGASMMLCDFNAYCPDGPGAAPFGGAGGSQSWSPIADHNNHWVNVEGSDNPCILYTNMFPDPPAWGITGEDNEELTRRVLCCPTTAKTTEAPDSPVPEPATPPNPLSAAADFLSGAKETDGAPASVVYEEAKEKYHVVGYDRSNGWTGQTYGAALEFCASKNSKVPCTYDAVCPMGSDGPPVGGVEEGPNGVWIATIDSPNGWIQVGHKNTCMKYSDLKPHPPMWGLTGTDNESVTRHVKCCDDVEGAVPVDVELKEVAKVSGTEEVVLDTMHPVWFSRRDGYHGTTHEEAELFCRSVGNMHLCPIEAYCPNGPGDEKVLFLQKDAFEGEQYSPVSSYNNDDTGVGNDWVMVGTKDGDSKSTCSQYEDLNDGKSPPWAADGSRTKLKEHVLCCLEQDDLKKEQDISRGMNPIWLDDKHGWNGGSYNDAVEFCQGVGGKRLCPYAAYCPHGPGMNPMGGHAVDFNLQGAQWAPVFGKDNEWVMIGRKYGNSATTCYTHDQLEGASPAWGLSDDNSSSKRNIQCCSF